MAEHLKTKCPLIRSCKGGENAPGLPAKGAHHIYYFLFIIYYL